MFKNTQAFSSYSVDDTEKARKFYRDVLEMEVTTVQGMENFGVLELHISGDYRILLYPKENHEPATFTVLNFPVDNIDEAVDKLIQLGISFEQYKGAIETDEKGIARSRGNEPNIAWFKDPAGNILSVVENK